MLKLPSIGCRREDLDTPCLIVDLDALEFNIRRMSEFFAEHRVQWRPHAKSYKCSALVRKVLDAGAIGITVAKLGEAEVLAPLGAGDVLITSPLVGRQKLDRLIQLRRTADPIVVVDHPLQVAEWGEAISRATGELLPIRVLIEIDLGMNRCGVLPGTELLALARQVAAQQGLELVGVMGWEGHLLTIENLQDKHCKIAQALGMLDTARRQLVDAELPCPMVSAGGTGSFQVTATLGIATEIEAGGGVFMDLFYANKCQVQGLEFALHTLTTVISRPTNERAVIDAGRKTLSPDLHLPAVRGRTDVEVQWLSAEHGVLKVLSTPGPQVGERLELIPGYGDWTTMLHDRIYAFRGERLEAIWPLEARGRLD